VSDEPARKWRILDAPSNLGLSPLRPGSVPGCARLPAVLRANGLVARLGADDRGTVVPPPYRAEHREEWGALNLPAIAEYTPRLADRIDTELSPSTRLLVLGGDCSILLGCMLALRRRGRFGLLFLDAHSDFRHPGNSPRVGWAAGEDLALVTGRGDPRWTDLESRRPYVRDDDVRLLGIRRNDECLEELRSLSIPFATSDDLRGHDPASAAARLAQSLDPACDGFWVHLDADVVDPSEISAVDSPEGPGLSIAELSQVLRELVANPRFVGLDVTIFDPDLDLDGTQSRRLTDGLVGALW
jgi:arginase